MRNHKALAAVASILLIQAVAGQDEVECPCIGLDATSLASSPVYDAQGDCLKYETPEGSTYCFPLSYGLDECKAHDTGLEPFCDKSGFPGNPDWCEQQWCWVDQQNCNVDNYDSSFFPGLGLRYSYRACGGSNTFSNWIGDGVTRSFSDLVTLIERYVVGVKVAVENEIDVVRDFSSNQENAKLECTPKNSCECSNQCEYESCWKADVNHYGVNLILNAARESQLNRRDVNFAKCVSNTISSQYLRISGKEYNDEDRIAYQYYGDQSTGGLIQWPEVKFCSDTYDARFRPWYASAASGPKDIVIVLDTSGSMSGTKMELAIQALKAVVRTLTWADYVSVVTFNNNVDKVFSETLLQANEDVVDRLVSFADKLSPNGGTNFDDPIAKAYEILKKSKNSNDRQSCSQAILFMTDGEASFDEPAFDSLVAEQPSVVIFSYALGSGAKQDALQRMACTTDGIFYPVAEAATLPEKMAGYYEYYVKLQPTCKLSWIKYSDAVTSTELVAGCTPIFDYADSETVEPEFVGVTCQDLNTIVSLDQLDSCTSQGYQQFIEQIQREAQSCPAATASGENGKITDSCVLRRLRASIGSSSLCPLDVASDCTVPPQPTNQSSCDALDPDRFKVIKLDGCDAGFKGKCQSGGGGGGLSTGAIGGIVAGVAAVLIAFLVVRHRRAKKCSNSKPPSNPVQQQQQQNNADDIPVAQAVPVNQVTRV